MSAPAAAGVQKIRRGIALSSEIALAEFLNHGRTLHVLGPLLRDFGEQAAVDIVAMRRAFERGTVSSSEWSFKAAESAAGRLRTLTGKLPPSERLAVQVELDRQMQTLQNKRDAFGKLFAEDVDAARAARKAAGKAADDLAKAAQLEKETDRLIAHLGDVIASHRIADDEVAEIWKVFLREASFTSPGVRKAAKYAAKRAKRIKELLKTGKMSRTLEGDLWNILGALGEDYALANRAWRARRDELMKAAEAAAKRLNDLADAGKSGGYEVRYLTQVDHGLKLNTSESVDAVVAIVNRDSREIYFFSTIQVKTADKSQGLSQIVDGLYRAAGKRGTGAVSVSRVDLVLDGEQTTFTLMRDPQMTESFYVLNAGGSTIPQEDIALIRRMNMTVTELKFELSVDQFTHMALDFMEAVAKAF